MNAIATVLLLFSLCVLRAFSQVAPYSYAPTVLEESCPAADAASDMRTNISLILDVIAAQINNESVCPELSNPEFGGVALTGRTIGSNATYMCDSGYVLEGDMTRVCERLDVNSADWSADVPTCQPICGLLENPTYGTVTLSGRNVSSTATYTCNTGYNLVGATTRMCELDPDPADWSGPVPTCEPTCPQLSNPASGTVTVTGTTLGSIATYTCNSGYSMAGAMTRFCRQEDSATADWYGEEPSCEAVCPELSNPAFGTVEITGRTIGSNATYTCHPGYDLVGTMTRTCEQLDMSSADWSAEVPTCQAICGLLDNPTFGTVTLSGRNVGSNATYTCNTGYNLVGTATRMCELNSDLADWSESAPICEPTCPQLTNSGFPDLRTFETTIGSIATYTCSSGYYLVGTPARFCWQPNSATAEWYGEEPSCEETPFIDKIYVMAFTSGVSTADSDDGHAIEVVTPGQTMQIPLPDLPADDQTLNKGDLWKLDLVNDFGFDFGGFSISICAIERVTIVAEGPDAWIIDSIMTYGCTDGGDCSPLTQDMDVTRTIQTDGEPEHQSFTLTRVSHPACT